jgi:AcrR family transcriptional regulator
MVHTTTKRLQRSRGSVKTGPAEPARSQTGRFAEKQAEIIAAATQLLLQRGLKGFTLAEVAERTGLITQGVGYYFPKKDDLATACILDAIERQTALVERALPAPTAEARIGAFYRGYFSMLSRIAVGEETQIAPLDEVRVLSTANYAKVSEALAAMFRLMRRLFDTPELEWMSRRERYARATLVMQFAMSIRGWENSRVASDYTRGAEKVIDIALRGLSAAPDRWAPPRLPKGSFADRVSAQDAFLRAATRLINEQGYRGASVEKISSTLNVSKGAFYHHNEAKDDVVVGCFERTMDFVTRAQLAASEMATSGLDRLTATAVALAEFQLSEDGPLLRTTAAYALPAGGSPRVARSWDRVVRRFSEMVIDAIADGSVRAVDPIVAGNLVMVTINSAVELGSWGVPDISSEEIASLYVRPLFVGVLAH